MSDITIEQVIDDLERVQSYNPETLVQRERLGADFSFEKAVEPAKALINLFRKLPSPSIEEFPANQRQQIQELSKSAYQLFSQIESFNAKLPDAEAQHAQMISQLSESYQPTFNKLFPYISFAVARTVDFNQLAAQGRSAVQSIKDEKAKFLSELEETSQTAQQVLDEVREAAAEQGVTQQARYFADEANAHSKAGQKWLIASVGMACLVAVYAVFTIFFVKIPILSGDTNAEIIQISIGKVLVFVVLAFSLLQCVKNYSAHRHNLVVNRHRQNALMTYTTLTEAGSSAEARDTVLQFAASAIYSPADTGYIKSEEKNGGGIPLFAVSPRSLVDASGVSS